MISLLNPTVAGVKTSMRFEGIREIDDLYIRDRENLCLEQEIPFVSYAADFVP
jgi:hypothetical protein